MNVGELIEKLNEFDKELTVSYLNSEELLGSPYLYYIDIQKVEYDEERNLVYFWGL